VRLDLAIYDGFSGSALVDARGRTLGVNTSGLARAAAVTIPAATVDHVVSQILEHGGVRYGYLGVGLQPVRLPAGAIARRDQPVGLIVVSLEPGGPAAGAGVLMGDILIGVDGDPITDPNRVFGLVRSAPVGGKLRLEVLRGGGIQEVVTTVGSRDWPGVPPGR
jgi:S1-C subfamily serine protease